LLAAVVAYGCGGAASSQGAGGTESAEAAGLDGTRPVHLSFLFDVSSSMGNRAERFELKWRPVVDATEAFFAEPEAEALSASLTFFPVADNQRRCDPESYERPDVPRTRLPSPAFAEAVEALGLAPTPYGWGGSTPTLAAFEGAARAVALRAAQAPGELQAIVLVTDGVPENCDDDRNDIAAVADAVAASGIATYVVGVDNLASDRMPNNLDNLHRVAEAGGSGRAFVIETGDPMQTQAELAVAIDDIRHALRPD
jgi:hypothetical protein